MTAAQPFRLDRDMAGATLANSLSPLGRNYGRDRNLVVDLDEGGFRECSTMRDDAIAPRGESLFQLQMPVRDNETRGDTQVRLAAFGDMVAAPECVGRSPSTAGSLRQPRPSPT